MTKFLVVNADDFGASNGINRGIIEAHTRGIVTSTSLMMSGKRLYEAVELSRANPHLSVGLHWDVWGEDDREFDLREVDEVRREFDLQLEQFIRVMGRPPTHVDSHRHAHRQEGLLPVFQEMVEPLGVPLRFGGDVNVIPGFYGQWEWMVTDLEHVGVPYLQHLLRTEVQDGWNEIGCHPAYVDPEFHSVYHSERETELRTLCDPAVRQTIDELGIRLVSYADYPAPNDSPPVP